MRFEVVTPLAGESVTSSAAFVARRVEMRQLTDCLEAARLGQPQVVCIEGDPGSGKSTLLSRFAASLGDAVVLQVGGDEAETLLSYGVVDQLHPETTTSPAMDPMAVGTDLLGLLDSSQAGGAGRVVVLVIDDLQWVDRPSARAVLFALRRLRADRVLAVVTTRSGGLDDPGWARFVSGDSRATRIHMGRLGPDDLTELASQLGMGVLSERGAARLAAHTEGNALYCRALLDEVGIGGLEAADDAGLPAPRELSAVILTRVAALAASTQAFLAAASVLGQHAPIARIASVAGLDDPSEATDAAVASGLLVESATASELSFAHPLYRAAIYADLSPTRRRALHAGAAALVAGRERLTHLVAATIGPDPGLAGELESLGQRAGRDGDVGASAWALEQAAALSAAVEDRDRRLLDAAVVLLDAADSAAAERVLTSCQLSSPRRDALTGLLEVYTGAPTAEVRLTAAWDAHDSKVEPQIGARAATSLTNWTVMAGRPDQALMWAERAVDSSAPGTSVWAMARTGQAYAFAAAGRSTAGLTVLGFLPASGNEVRLAETDALIMRGMLRLYADDLAGAIADLGTSAARLRTGLPSSYPGPCMAHLSDAYFRRGDWDSALTHAQLAAGAAQDTDRPLDLARAHGRAAQVLAFRGEWSAARRHVAAARAAAERFPLVLAIANAAVAGASLAFAQGDFGGVIDATEPVRATGLLALGGCPGIVNWRAVEADALIGLGRLDDADSALNEFADAIPAAGLPSAELALARCRGNLAVARSQPAQAQEDFARARSIEAEVPMPFERALLDLDDGRRLRATGNRSAAIAKLEQAHRALSDLGADPFVRTCATELDALQVTAAPDSSATLLGLSRAEAAVARLVATGLTNREVAGQLYISVKTVEYHLRNTYLKLDITSRRDLAARLA